MKLSMRSLLTTGLYGISAALAVTNLVLTGGELSTADLAISVWGIVPWGVAAAHSIYRKYQARRRDVNPTAPPDNPCLRNSTHSTINSALHMTAASGFIASDLTHVKESSPAMTVRVIGSAIWLSCAGLYCWLSRSHERPQEDHPERVIKPYGIKSSTYQLVGELAYLTAGGLYQASWLLDPTHSTLKLIGNVCWLTAGLHDTLQASYTVYQNQHLPQSSIQTIHFKPAPLALTEVKIEQPTEKIVALKS